MKNWFAILFWGLVVVVSVGLLAVCGIALAFTVKGWAINAGLSPPVAGAIGLTSALAIIGVLLWAERFIGGRDK